MNDLFVFSATRADFMVLDHEVFIGTKILDTSQPKIYLTLKLFYLTLCTLFSFCRLKYNDYHALIASIFTKFTKKLWNLTTHTTIVGREIFRNLTTKKSPDVTIEAENKNYSHEALRTVSCGAILFIVLACEFFCNGFFKPRRKIA